MELDRIFEILMRKGCITTYELTRLGYISEDITEIINDGLIKRKERGVYVFGNPDKVLDYANSISSKKEEFSKKLIDYCNLIKGVNIEPYYETFDKAIQNKDVKTIFEYFEKIDIVLSKDSEKIKTSNLYLILLRYLFNTPIGYYNRLEDIDLDNIDSYDLLNIIGKKRGMLVSGGEVNTERAAIMLLDEFRSAKLGRITVEMPNGELR